MLMLLLLTELPLPLLVRIAGVTDSLALLTGRKGAWDCACCSGAKARRGGGDAGSRVGVCEREGATARGDF